MSNHLLNIMQFLPSTQLDNAVQDRAKFPLVCRDNVVLCCYELGNAGVFLLQLCSVDTLSVRFADSVLLQGYLISSCPVGQLVMGFVINCPTC